MRRVTLLLAMAVVVGLAMGTGVDAFTSPVSPISPISPIDPAKPTPEGGIDVIVDGPRNDDHDDDAGMTATVESVEVTTTITTTTEICVRVVSGFVVCYEGW